MRVYLIFFKWYRKFIPGPFIFIEKIVVVVGKGCFFTILITNTVIPGLSRDLMNGRRIPIVFNWQIPGQARDDSLIKYFCFHKQHSSIT
ncbi:MAG: hypothetical protein JWP12_3209 [Bacteroidetes bacterium]|nr:hypothetical protein [Bacteroidota bacterium]